MFLRALAYIGGASALVVLYVVLAIVIAVDLALIGVIDSVVVVDALAPIYEMFLQLVVLLGEILPAEGQPVEANLVHVIYLK